MGIIVATVLVFLANRPDSEFVHGNYPNLDIAKSGSQIFVDSNRAVVRYVITVTNSGPVAINNILVRDVLETKPSTVVNITGGGVYNGFDLIIWSGITLAANSSIQLQYDAVFPDYRFGETVTNRAHLAVDENNNGIIDDGEAVVVGRAALPVGPSSSSVTTMTSRGESTTSDSGYVVQPPATTSAATTSSATSKKKTPPPYNLK